MKSQNQELGQVMTYLMNCVFEKAIRVFRASAWIAALAIVCGSVAAADRVGVRLAGAPVPGGEVTSEGVPVGAVQVPPGGSPIVLLADRGTLGGYAKPALVHPADLPRLAQLRPGDRVRFVAAARG